MLGPVEQQASGMPMLTLDWAPALQLTPYTVKPFFRKISARMRLSRRRPMQVAMPIFCAPIFRAKSMISSTRVCLQ